MTLRRRRRSATANSSFTVRAFPFGWNGLAISNHLATYRHAGQMQSAASFCFSWMFEVLVALFITAQRVQIRDNAGGLMKNRLVRFTQAVDGESRR